MMIQTITIALALLVQGEPAVRAEGRVVQATAIRAYLDAGADDGLVAGGDVIFHRGGREVASCRLQDVAARFASCPVLGVHPGDTFDLPAPPAREIPKVLPPPLSAEVLAAQARAVAAAPIAAVEYKAQPRPAEGRRSAIFAVELSEVAWVTTSASPFAGTRAGVSIRSAEIGLGLKLDLDAQAIRWSSRPSPRFRPNDSSLLYVWQAGLSRDPVAEGAAVSVGRLMPWRIPGATIMDGATAGWRFSRLELGAFGGLVPDPSTLAIATDRATGGGYWVWDHGFGKGIALRDEGRVAMVSSPELGNRIEAETRAAARFGRALDLTGSVRLGLGGDVKAPGNLDGARLELSTRPLEHVRLAGWFAYDGLDVPGDLEPMVFPGRSRRAEASASWDAGPGLRFTLLGGTAMDLTSKLDRQWVGPVLDLPRLLFGRGGLSLGYLEELGWSDGRSAWLQLVARPWSRLRVMTRVSWSHASGMAVMQDELGLALAAVADLTHTFSARLSVASRGSFGLDGGGAFEGGATVLGTVAARY
jgi:hypothetical protein